MKSQEKNENGVLKGANKTTKKKILAWKEELVFWGNRPAVAGLAGWSALSGAVILPFMSAIHQSAFQCSLFNATNLNELFGVEALRRLSIPA